MRQLDGLIQTKRKSASKNTNKKSSAKKEFIGINTGKDFWRVFISIIVALTIIYFVPIQYNFSKMSFELTKMFLKSKVIVLLQNNSELRPSGGFLGSYAIIENNFPKVSSSINTNIYNLDDKYQYMLQINAPEPLKSFLNDIGGKYWSLHDANWWPDFSASANQIEWFYREEGGTGLDGVISINASVIKDLLGLIGPIELEKYSITVDQNNFYQVIAQEVERNYYQNPDNVEQNQPKTILADLKPIISSKAKELPKLKLISFINDQCQHNQIQFHFNNIFLQKLVELTGYSGNIINSNSSDYLYINNANIGGQKSSINIKQSIKLESSIDSTGLANDTVTITRIHQGTGEWPDGDNKNYMRVIVPKNSQLSYVNLSGEDITSKVDISQDFNKTIYGFWINTPVGGTQTVILNYQLAKRIKNPNKYSLYWQKQSGVINDEVQIIANDKSIFNGLIDRNLLIKSNSKFPF